MKKRGFTLVELIASIAIIAIIMTAASPAFLMSIKLWKNNRAKINTMAYSQAIAEYYKSNGMENLKTIYDSSEKNSDLSTTNYIYFDNDCGDAMKKTIDDNASRFGKTAVEDYNTCKTRNTGNKKYGAFLKIFKVSGTTNTNVFGVRVVVWNFANGNEASSSRVLYLER